MSFSIQLAYAVDHDSYGLIFGFNTFLSLVLMTALTLTVADEHGLDLDIRTQVCDTVYCICIHCTHYTTFLCVVCGVWWILLFPITAVHWSWSLHPHEDRLAEQHPLVSL